MSIVHGRYVCVVFDLDGTLLDTRSCMVTAINATLDSMQRRPVSAPELRDAMHLGFAAMMQQAIEITGPTLEAHEFQRMCAEATRRYLESAHRCVRTYPDVLAMLEQLHRARIWMGVCTNQLERDARRLLDAFQLIGYFREVIGRDTLGVCKPNPLPLIWLMGRAGARPNSTLMVGDSEVDALCAQQANVNVMLMEHGYGYLEARSPHTRSPDFISLSQLLLA